MKAFITGGVGQDGTYLSEYLWGLGYSVMRFDLKFGDDVRDDALVTRRILDFRPDEIYHLASPMPASRSWTEPDLFFDVNVHGFLNVLRAARHTGSKVYHQASGDMFDGPAPQDENSLIMPRSPYGASKAAALELGRLFHERWGLHVSCGISFHHSSKRQTEQGIVWKAVKGAKEAGPGHPLVLGNLDAIRDWSHASDVVRAQHLILQQPPGPWIIGSGMGRSVRELAVTALLAAGKSEDWLEIDPRLVRDHPDDGPLIADTAKLRALGWQPKVSFEAMIAEMVAA